MIPRCYSQYKNKKKRNDTEESYNIGTKEMLPDLGKKKNTSIKFATI